ncbi:MAG TPA: hypothetical protein VFM96_11355 [Gaiellaceae bacterium]|nr:hypothetical protein [Gaiellaceae bacterium]
MRVWTKRAVEGLAGRATPALASIFDRFEEKAVEVNSDEETYRAWGQYLDDEHHSPSQWGFFGTSAGVQVLTAKMVALGTGDLATDDRLISLALKLLPEDLENAAPVLAGKKAKGDFENIMKLLFIAEALRPDDDNVGRGQEPALVDTILGRALDEKFWSSRSSTDPARFHKDRIIPTIFGLLALRRYQAVQNSRTYAQARSWLADRLLLVGRANPMRTPLNMALVGLALMPAARVRNEAANVTQARTQCTKGVLRWASHERTVVLDRPVFIGFALTDSTDYTFLYPELVATLYLLRMGNPRRGRRFVLKVVDSLVSNIERAGGFVSQGGNMASVDQLWAVRVLREFVEAYERPGWKYHLLPVADLRLTLASRRAQLFAFLSSLAVAAGIFYSVEGSLKKAAAGWVTAVVLAIGAALITPTGDGDFG